jgi:tRNA G10  N-methylase Trm11
LTVLWHKIVCRKPPGTIAFGRPSYSHMIALGLALPASHRAPGSDVLPDAGPMTWSRAMGVEACRVACRYLRDDVGARVVVDPFCGRGTVLAVANAMGLDAVGVDLSGRRCRAARSFTIAE